MSYNFSSLQKELTDAAGWLVRECGGVRTGRATPSLLDQVNINVYGSRLPLKQISSITLEDQRTLRVTPWDKAQIKEIEEAIVRANLGVSTTPDAAGLRVIFPSLTEESRAKLVKAVEQKHEQAKVSVRRLRDKTWNDIQEKEKAGDFGEDEKFRLNDELQKLVDETNKKLEEITEKKRVELAQ